MALERFLRKYPDKLIDVPCGKCEACLTRKANEWSFRLFHEWQQSDNATFVTLTYHDGDLPRLKDGTPCFSVRDVQNFLKRLRKKYGNGIRYFLVSEYGSDRGRPHYHCLLFNLNVDQSKITWRYDLENDLFNIWKHGGVVADEVISERIIYCSKYCLSSLDWIEGDAENYYSMKEAIIDAPMYVDVKGRCRKLTLKNFILSSRKPGIGTCYLTDSVMNHYRTNPNVCCGLPNGISYPMARFYKDKLFDDEMKEVIKEQVAKYLETPTAGEIEAYKYKIRRNFKKSHKLNYE